VVFSSSLQKQAERLFDVLFTKPKNFAKDLGQSIHAAGGLNPKPAPCFY
jgi:hypothetical protein